MKQPVHKLWTKPVNDTQPAYHFLAEAQPAYEPETQPVCEPEM